MYKLIIPIYCLVLLACNSNKSKVTITTPQAKDTVPTSNNKPATSNQSIPQEYLVTPTSFGVITKSMNLAQLTQAVGTTNITKGTEPLNPETDEQVDILIIYKGTPKEITLRWKYGKPNKEIGSISTTKPNAPYITNEGIRVGTTLAQLTAINNDVISFSGLAWGLGGYIIDYGAKGTLGTKDNQLYNICLTSTLQEQYPADYPLGETTFNTNMPNVKKHNTTITVQELALNFFADNQ